MYTIPLVPCLYVGMYTIPLIPCLCVGMYTIPLQGVALIAKFCVNIFLECRTHFGHIVASPYAK